MGALVAVKHNRTLKAFYERLLAAGKEKMVALIAVAQTAHHPKRHRPRRRAVDGAGIPCLIRVADRRVAPSASVEGANAFRSAGAPRLASRAASR
jgi:hypothetical protein